MPNVITEEFLRAIPKTDLHVHLDGSLRITTLIDLAKERNIPLVLADRSIQTTFTRIWRGMRGKDKFKLLSSFVSSVFEEEDISEEDIATLTIERHELVLAFLEGFKGCFIITLDPTSLV